METLRIAPEEAKTVRIIFRKYRGLGTMPAVKTHLNRMNLTSRVSKQCA